mmetsp:Transcript_4483/g.11602  ORF Transcript_4483/g.11602 Transcript_4483/m.11602 type:complete len:276 (+) Transcript_4483:72-899(+)
MACSEHNDHFSGEATRLYTMISENHRQPDGPWHAMLQAVQDSTAASPHPKILELATGPGEPAATIARALPGASVVATDVSDDMVDAARETCREIGNMTAEKADMMDLGKYGDGSFDVVTCCYGFMFPPDKELALAEAYRVLRPDGGVLVATVWNSLPKMGLLRGMMEHVLGEAPPPPPVNPLSLSAPGLFEGIVEKAGFAEVIASAHEYSFNYGSDKDLIFKQTTMPVMAALEKFGGWEKARAYFEAEKLSCGEFDAEGNYIVKGNVFKLVIAIK